MKPMTAAIAAFLLCAPAAIAAPTAAQSAITVPANAQEQAPEALLGAWKADIAASRYTGTAPRKNIRTFSYTKDGKLLVASVTLNAAGQVSMLHWAVSLDGAPAPEFTQSSRSVPASLVSLKMQDARTLKMVVSKHGAVNLTGQFVLSEDGKTLRYSYGAPGGPQNDIVYRRWDMTD